MRCLTLSSLLWIILMVTLPVRVMSQNGYADSVKEIKNELKNYQAQLETIEQNLVTYADYELYSSTYRNCVERMDVFYEANKTFIALESQILFDIWSNIKDMREEIDKKIETLNQEAQVETLTRELEAELTLTALKYEQLSTTSSNEEKGCQRHAFRFEE